MLNNEAFHLLWKLFPMLFQSGTRTYNILMSHAVHHGRRSWRWLDPPQLSPSCDFLQRLGISVGIAAGRRRRHGKRDVCARRWLRRLRTAVTDLSGSDARP